MLHNHRSAGINPKRGVAGFEEVHMSTHSGVLEIQSLVPNAVRALQRRETLLPRTSVVAAVAAIFHRHVFAGISGLVADALIAFVRFRSAKIAGYVVFFEGIKTYLLKDLLERAAPPPADLTEPLERLLRKNRETTSQLSEVAAALRRVNATSRLANEFDRVCAMLRDLDESLTFILEITEEGVAHAVSLEKLRGLDGSINAKIDRYMDDEELDPELLALAEQAIHRIKAEAKSADVRN